MEHDELGYNYSDTIAERVQAYMWLFVEVSHVEKQTRLFDEGMTMLETIRLSIAIPDKAVLKGIRGGKV